MIWSPLASFLVYQSKLLNKTHRLLSNLIDSTSLVDKTICYYKYFVELCKDNAKIIAKNSIYKVVNNKLSRNLINKYLFSIG